MMADTGLTGVVMTTKPGYCFIKRDVDPAGENMFAHITNLRDPEMARNFQQGMRLRFTLGKTSKGYRALDIEVIG
jgi:cold shock CspA family protein